MHIGKSLNIPVHYAAFVRDESGTFKLAIERRLARNLDVILYPPMINFLLCSFFPSILTGVCVLQPRPPMRPVVAATVDAVVSELICHFHIPPTLIVYQVFGSETNREGLPPQAAEGGGGSCSYNAGNLLSGCG